MSAMRVFLAAMIAIALASCNCSPDAATHTSQGMPHPGYPLPVVQKPPEPPKPPSFDLSFETDAQVAAWVGKVKAQAEAGKSLPDAKPFIDALSAFKPPARITDAFPKPQTGYENADEVPEAKPDPAEAKRLEKEGEHWEAGQLYMRLKDTASVRRCTEALKEKGEWKVVPILAANIGNQKMFDLAIDTLVDEDRMSDVMSIFVDVVEAGRKDFVQAAMARNKIDLAGDYERAEEFANAGWTEPLRTLVRAAFKTKGNPELGKADMLRHILACAFDDKEILRAYFQQEDAEVVLTDCHCGGEGSSSTEVISEAAELWKAVAKDAALRDAYAKDVKQQFAKPDPEDAVINCEDAPCPGSSYDALNPEDVLGELVNLFDEARKDAAWTKVLADALADTSPYVREIGRLALGQKANAKAEDLKPRQRYLVAWISGARPNADDLDSADDDDLPSEDLFGILSEGTLAPAEAKRLWKLVGLPEDDDALRIAPKDQAAALEATGLSGENADILRARLIRSGAGAKALPGEHFSPVPSGICQLNSDQTFNCAGSYPKTAFAAVTIGLNWPVVTAFIAQAVKARIWRAWSDRGMWYGTLWSSLTEPYAVADKNYPLKFGGNVNPFVGPKCSDVGCGDALVNRAIEEIRPVLAVEDYETVLLDLAKASHYGPYTAEIARRVKTNDIAGLTRLKLSQ